MVVVLPVIHHRDDDDSLAAAAIAFAAGADGVFLIQMSGYDHLLDAPACAIKAAWPDKFVGCNRLSAAPTVAVARDAALGLDGSWHDAPGINSRWLDNPEVNARRMSDLADVEVAVREAQRTRPGFAFFASVAFKGQPRDPSPGSAALAAARRGWVPTTSGVATGVAADLNKLSAVRAAIGDLTTFPLAVASGVTPENAAVHAAYVTHILVATGISYPDRDVFDPARLSALMAALGRASE